MPVVELDQLADVSKQTQVSQKLPKMHMVAPHIVRTHDHLYFGTIKAQGVYVDLESVQTINQYDDKLHMIIKGLEQDFGVYFHLFRRKVESDFHVHGESAFTKEFTAKYRDKYQNAELYRNELYITVVYRGLSGLLKPSNLFSRFKKSPSNQSFVTMEERDNISEAIGKLNAKLHEVCDQLGKDNDFHAEVIDDVDEETDKNLEYSNVLSFLGSFVNGLEKLSYRYPNEPMFGYNSKNKAKEFSKYPYGNIGEFLACGEPVFSKKLKRYLINERSTGEAFLGSIINVKNYGVGTTPISFDRLLRTDSELLITVSYFPLTRDQSLRKAKRAREKHVSTGDKAESQIEQIVELEDDVASEHVSMGAFHNSVMVLSEYDKTQALSSQKKLDRKCHEVIKIYSEAGMRAFVETWNTNSAFWAQFPCNRKYIMRSRPVTSDVVCHFFPLHNYPTGHTHCTHLGEGICLIDTPSQTPMWFNWHSKGSGSKTEIEPAHSFMAGANKFGKTVFLLTMNALAEKYGTRSFLFDYEHGMYAYAKFTNSPYMSYDVESGKDIKHNPFLMKDCKDTRLFCLDFLCDIARDEKETALNSETLKIEIDAEVKEELKNCVNYAFEHIPVEQRTLSNVCDLYLSPKFSRWTQLKPFLRANAAKQRDDGEYCEFFDNDEDIFNGDQRKTFFETSKLKEQPRLKTVLLKYLFYKIKDSRNYHNDPVAIIIDEMWYNLDDPSWAGWMKAELATLRKKDMHILGATQSVDSLINSPIAKQFLTNCATTIFAPNGSASVEGYKDFNLTPSEFAFIKKTPITKRLFLYKQAHETAIGKLNLAGFDRYLAVLSSNPKVNKVLNALLDEHQAHDNPESVRELYYENLGIK